MEQDAELLTVESAAMAENAHAYRVTLTGDLDLGSAPQLEAALAELIESGATMLVLEASAVEFMDSTGLRAIVAATNRIEAAGGQMLIEGMSGAAQRVLEITGLLDRYKR